ncbi:MAG TPA: class F sortase, partial [Pseudonocardiaceae bacterium]|nr:class F sortase [Pseudonocardiaceae bacterium]
GHGTVRRFRVTQVITVPKDLLPAQAPTLFGQSGPRRIVLATCGGEWVGGQEGYNENRVLIATPV